MSAQLAQRGFTGTPALIESRQYEGWVGDLGEQYLIDGGVTAKEYSSCAWTHPALAAVKKLRGLHEIPLEDIARIDVRTFAEACRLHVRLPETTEEAQFSLPWTVAVMLVDGDVGPEQVLGDRLGDPLVRRLATKVVAHARQDLTALHALSEDFDPAGKDVTGVTIHLLDGTVIESGLVELPLQPLTLSQVEVKLRRITNAVMGRAECEHLIDIAEGLEAAPSVDHLVAALAAAKTMNTGSGRLAPLSEQRR
jgi:2-methylcitrate dehydratase PrpD